MSAPAVKKKKARAKKAPRAKAPPASASDVEGPDDLKPYDEGEFEDALYEKISGIVDLAAELRAPVPEGLTQSQSTSLYQQKGVVERQLAHEAGLVQGALTAMRRSRAISYDDFKAHRDLTIKAMGAPAAPEAPDDSLAKKADAPRKRPDTDGEKPKPRPRRRRS